MVFRAPRAPTRSQGCDPPPWWTRHQVTAPTRSSLVTSNFNPGKQFLMEVLLLEEQPLAGVVLWFSHSPPPRQSPGGSDGKESTCSAEDPGLIPGSGRLPWRRKWQPSPVLLPGESRGQRSLQAAGSESDTTEQLTFSPCQCWAGWSEETTVTRGRGAPVNRHHLWELAPPPPSLCPASPSRDGQHAVTGTPGGHRGDECGKWSGGPGPCPSHISEGYGRRRPPGSTKWEQLLTPGSSARPGWC